MWSYVIFKKVIVQSISLFFILITTITTQADQNAQFPMDQEEAEQGRIELVQPLTFGAALQNELDRSESVNEVFPPPNLSYFVPYGDRTIVVTQFPNVAPEQFQNDWSGSGSSRNDNVSQSSYGSPQPQTLYGTPPVYGPPPPPPPPKQSQRQDTCVIISQNFLYRQNVRDIGNFGQIFRNDRNTRPSQEILKDVGRMLAMSKGSRGRDLSSVLNYLNPDVLRSISQGYGGSSSNGWKMKRTTPSESFALVMIESRVRVSRTLEELSLTNGSVIFLSPSDPQVLTFVPFVLRESGDVQNVFQGYEDDMKGLVPQERQQLLGFLKLVEGLHEDTHYDGRERVERIRRLSSALSRPRFNFPIYNDTMEQEQAELASKNTHWLHSSTVALRSFTPRPQKKTPPPLTYGPHPPPPPLLSAVQHKHTPIVQSPPQETVLEVRPAYQVPVKMPPTMLAQIQRSTNTNPLLNYGTPTSSDDTYFYRTIFK